MARRVCNVYSYHNLIGLILSVCTLQVWYRLYQLNATGEDPIDPDPRSVRLDEQATIIEEFKEAIKAARKNPEVLDTGDLSVFNAIVTSGGLQKGERLPTHRLLGTEGSEPEMPLIVVYDPSPKLKGDLHVPSLYSWVITQMKWFLREHAIVLWLFRLL